MSDIYVEQLEMQLRFAEEEAQERERVAFEMGKEQGRADAIDEVIPSFCLNCDQVACDGGMHGSVQECETIRMLRDTLEQLKEQKNG